MSGWIASIVGIVLLGALVEILLPDGDSRKYIRGVYGLIVVLVIVAPLPKWLGMFGNSDAETPSSDQQISIDREYVDKVWTQCLERDAQSMERVLKNNGYPNVKVVLTAGQGNIYVVGRVRLDLTRDAQALENREDVERLAKKRFPNAEVIVVGT